MRDFIPMRNNWVQPTYTFASELENLREVIEHLSLIEIVVLPCKKCDSLELEVDEFSGTYICMPKESVSGYIMRGRTTCHLADRLIINSGDLDFAFYIGEVEDE